MARVRPATGGSIGERLLANIDNVALALGVVAFLVASSLGPAYACGSSYVEDTSTASNVLMVVSALSFAVAAFAALGWARQEATGLRSYTENRRPVPAGLSGATVAHAASRVSHSNANAVAAM